MERFVNGSHPSHGNVAISQQKWKQFIQVFILLAVSTTFAPRMMNEANHKQKEDLASRVHLLWRVASPIMFGA